jgi:hypothetical protein
MPCGFGRTLFFTTGFFGCVFVDFGSERLLFRCEGPRSPFDLRSQFFHLGYTHQYMPLSMQSAATAGADNSAAEERDNH